METQERPRVLSFGGVVQSSALVALLGRGEYPGAALRELQRAGLVDHREVPTSGATRIEWFATVEI